MTRNEQPISVNNYVFYDYQLYLKKAYEDTKYITIPGTMVTQYSSGMFREGWVNVTSCIMNLVQLRQVKLDTCRLNCFVTYLPDRLGQYILIF